MDHSPKKSPTSLEHSIFTIKGVQVMIDFHLAELFQVETKRLNEQVKRNAKRFPHSFMFQLTNDEWQNLQSQIATAKTDENLRSQFATAKRRNNPYAFTEQGVAMLSVVLNSDIAISVSIQIMEAFVKMRQSLLENSLIKHRIDKIELKQLENDKKFEQIFTALESKNGIPEQGVFFDGQVFDAYELASRIIRSASKSIVLIDNYIDESTLLHLSKKNNQVKIILLSKNIDNRLALDIKKVNEQYGNFEIREFNKSHDRFLIIDNLEIYHLGASLKDLGKKPVVSEVEPWFAFTQLNKNSVSGILNSIIINEELIKE